MAWNKSPNQKDAVRVFLVMNDSGTIDIDASCAKFRNVALQLMAGQEAETDLITSCISEVFGQYKGARLNADFVTGATIVKMVAQVPALDNPSLHTMLRKRILEVLKDLTGEGKPYGISKGPGNGRFCWTDQA
jgi:hypothetical protein